MSLLEDLTAGEQKNTMARPCQMCEALKSIEDEETRIALTRAASGTIGRDKLAQILHRNGLPVGRRAIERHRQEGHSS